MLVKFDSPAGSLFMFDHVAQRCLELMGHSGDIPSAVDDRDLPKVLARFERAVDELPSPMPEQIEVATSRGLVVPLQYRALPLLDLMRRASNRHTYVQWAYVLPK